MECRANCLSQTKIDIKATENTVERGGWIEVFHCSDCGNIMTRRFQHNINRTGWDKGEYISRGKKTHDEWMEFIEGKPQQEPTTIEECRQAVKSSLEFIRIHQELIINNKTMIRELIMKEKEELVRQQQEATVKIAELESQLAIEDFTV